MRVVVVGGGFGGMASAARLAKLGHDVTLLERSGAAGRCGGDRRAGGLRLGRRAAHHAAARGDPRPVPQVRPALGEGGRRAGAARADPGAPLRGPDLGAAPRRVPHRTEGGVRRARERARRHLDRVRRRVRRGLGRAASSLLRGPVAARRPAARGRHVPRRSRDHAQAAAPQLPRRPAGDDRRPSTPGRRTRHAQRAVVGRAWSLISSRASGCGPYRAGWPGSRPRWSNGWRPAASPCSRTTPWST